MSFFTSFCSQYVSNTVAAGGSQHHFSPADPEQVFVGRLYYRLFEGGTLEYSLLFSNTVDSTFADGKDSRQGHRCGVWKITHLRLGVTDTPSVDTDRCEIPVTIAGRPEYTVRPGEAFATDAVTLTASTGQYLCVEIGFCGDDIPYHAEAMIPTFVRQGHAWLESREFPFPSMIGCRRHVQQRVAYLGDSITQGIGVPFGKYSFWNALLSERLGHQNAYWNLGLGFGRAMDAAADDTWLDKAKQNDAVLVCYGVNDLGRDRCAEQILSDLDTIQRKLKQAGCRVLLQTVPPFDYPDPIKAEWEKVNRGIRDTLSQQVDALFDVVPVLQQDDAHPHIAKYGGHPNADGSRAWADALFPVAEAFLKK